MPAQNSKLQNFREWLFRATAVICASSVIIIMAGMALSLIIKSYPAMEAFGFSFLSDAEWNPVTNHFGALSSIYGTTVSTIIALVIAVPLSLGVAIFLVELSHPLISKFVGYAVELLAAIPSIIYGMWGLFVFAPFMADHVQPLLGKYLGFLPLFQGPPMGIGMLTAGIILALMILPFISAVMRDVFAMVPKVVKEAAYGTGATLWEVVSKVTVKYGAKGLLGAVFLGLGRALGETMAVTFVIGNKHKIDASLFSAGNSIASTLANEFTEASEALYLSSLFKLGLILFGITILIQIIAQLWIAKAVKGAGGGV